MGSGMPAPVFTLPSWTAITSWGAHKAGEHERCTRPLADRDTGSTEVDRQSIDHTQRREAAISSIDAEHANRSIGRVDVVQKATTASDFQVFGGTAGCSGHAIGIQKTETPVTVNAIARNGVA